MAIPFPETLDLRSDRTLQTSLPSISQGSGPPGDFLLGDFPAGWDRLWSAQWASHKLHLLVCTRESDLAGTVTAWNLPQLNVKCFASSSLISGMQEVIKP